MALRTRIVLTLTALALLLPSSALAAGWTGFASLPTTGGTVTGLKFATDSAGNEAALWIEPVAGGPYKVLAAVRHPGGAWSSVQTLDASSTSLPLIDLAVDPAGNFIAAYTRPATRVVL